MKHLLQIMVVVLVGLMLIQSVSAFTPTVLQSSNAQPIDGRGKMSLPEKIAEDVKAKLCIMTDQQIMASGVLRSDLIVVKKFCEKSKEEMKDFFAESLSASSKGDQKVYTCGGKSGIPNYSNVGVTSSSCSWHDPTSFLCKIEGGVACLWGCTNADPVLGWHTKSFTSKTQLQGEIISKGYYLVAAQYGGSYRRILPYGYSYQVHQISGNTITGQGTWHSEGPEPNSEPNWPGILGGWYPGNSLTWHNTC